MHILANVRAFQYVVLHAMCHGIQSLLVKHLTKSANSAVMHNSNNAALSYFTPTQILQVSMQPLKRIGYVVQPATQPTNQQRAEVASF